MDRRTVCVGTALALTGAPLALAQTAKRVARVGWLGWSGDSAPVPSMPLAAFRSGLAGLGWREGDNLVLELRRGDRDQAAALADDLMRAKVDVIVGTALVFGARSQTGSTPIVFGINGDPVEAGLVASLARPGGHLTGITALSEELTGLRMEMLKSSRPGMRRVAALANDRHPGLQTELRAARAAATQLGLELKYFPVRSTQDFAAAYAAIAAEGFNGLIAFPDAVINGQAKDVAEFTQRHRLPAISGWAEFAHAGNLMSYGTSHQGFYRHLAVYVDKILKGAKPADLPVEQPTRFEMVLNLKAAKVIGLAVPGTLMLRATEVIE